MRLLPPAVFSCVQPSSESSAAGGGFSLSSVAPVLEACEAALLCEWWRECECPRFWPRTSSSRCAGSDSRDMEARQAFSDDCEGAFGCDCDGECECECACECMCC